MFCARPDVLIFKQYFNQRPGWTLKVVFSKTQNAGYGGSAVTRSSGWSVGTLDLGGLGGRMLFCTQIFSPRHFSSPRFVCWDKVLGQLGEEFMHWKSPLFTCLSESIDDGLEHGLWRCTSTRCLYVVWKLNLKRGWYWFWSTVAVCWTASHWFQRLSLLLWEVYCHEEQPRGEIDWEKCSANPVFTEIGCAVGPLISIKPCMLEWWWMGTCYSNIPAQQ